MRRPCHCLIIGGCAALAAALLLVSCQARVERAQPPPAPPSRPAGTAYPLTLISDEAGLQVTIPAAPRRIVSLAPSVTEILFAIGAGDRIVGVTEYADYPEQAKTIERVGGYSDFSLEKIVALGPDLVVAAFGNPKERLDQLRRLGLTVYGVNPTSYLEVADTIERLGTICDTSARAGEVAAHMRRALEETRARTASLAPERRPSVLCIVSLEPLIVAGPGSFMDDMLQACGATNAAQEAQKPWAEISMEAVVVAEPEVIIGTNMGQGPISEEEYLARLRARPAWAALDAVKAGRVAIVEDDPVTIPGPRLAEGLRQMAEAIHPELFGERRKTAGGRDGSRD